MNMIPVSSLLTSPARLHRRAVERQLKVDLLDDPDMRHLVRYVAVNFPLTFDAAWHDLEQASGGAA